MKSVYCLFAFFKLFEFLLAGNYKVMTNILVETLINTRAVSFQPPISCQGKTDEYKKKIFLPKVNYNQGYFFKTFIISIIELRNTLFMNCSRQ